MTKSELFKKAHAMAKATVEAVGNYSIAFKLALTHAYTEKKPLEGSNADLIKVIQSKLKVYSMLNHDVISKLLNLIIMNNKEVSQVVRRVHKMFMRYGQGTPVFKMMKKLHHEYTEVEKLVLDAYFCFASQCGRYWESRTERYIADAVYKYYAGNKNALHLCMKDIGL